MANSGTIGLRPGVEGEKAFKKALADINQSFKVLGSEMKSAASEFDKEDKSLAAITARNEVLNKSIDAQKDKIATLQSALRNASESFGENDRRTRQWQIQLNNANAALNDMEREVSDNEASLDDMGKKLDAAADSADKGGGKFEKLGGVPKGIGAALGAAAVAAGAAAVKLGQEAVRQFGELEQNLGGSEAVFGEYAASIQKTGEDAYKNLGVSQSQYIATANKMGALFQGSGVEQQKSLELTEKAMQRAADMASVMGIDMQMVLDSVAGAAKGNFTMTDNLGVAMNATTIEAYALSKGITTAYKDMSDTQKTELAMQMFFEKTEQYAGNFASESTQTISGSMGLMKALFDSFIAGLGNADADMTNLTGNMADAFKAVVTNIAPVVENIAHALPDAVGAMLGAVGELLPMLLDTVVNLFTQVLTTLLSLLPELIPAAIQAIMTIVTALIDNLPLLLDAALQLVTALVQGIAQALPELIPASVNAIVTIVEGLIANLPLLLDAALQLILGLADGLLAALPQLIAKLPAVINAIVAFLTRSTPQITDAGIKLLVSLVATLPDIIAAVIAAVPQIVFALVKAFFSYQTIISGVGKSIVLGIWDGIASMADTFRQKVSDFFSGIVSSVKGVLGIASPSKVFASIGDNMALGLGEGFENAMTDVEKDIKSAVPTDFDLNLKGAVNAAGAMITPNSSYYNSTPLVVQSDTYLDGRMMLRNTSRNLAGFNRSYARAAGV